jgi:hypothetical protein
MALKLLSLSSSPHAPRRRRHRHHPQPTPIKLVLSFCCRLFGFFSSYLVVLIFVRRKNDTFLNPAWRFCFCGEGFRFGF